jgi:uncharacterized protein
MNRRELGIALVGGTLAVGGLAAVPACAQRDRRSGRSRKKRVLVISETAGFRHSSIQTASTTVRALGVGSGLWEVVGEAGDKGQVAAAITADNLRDLDLVFFANTTGTLGFTPEGKSAFYDWIRRGGAYAGVHSAGDTFHDDPEYLNLVRGEFQTHGPQVKVIISNQDPGHPATVDVPATWEIYDEIYEFKNWERSKVHVLLTMHKHPQRDEQGDFPIAWTNRVGDGRMFYTALGHREDVYQNEVYLKHLLGGVRWALGLARGSDSPGNPLR